MIPVSLTREHGLLSKRRGQLSTRLPAPRDRPPFPLHLQVSSIFVFFGVPNKAQGLFLGTRVAVFGALVPSSSNSSLNVASTYSIDNSKTITYRPPANTTVENDNVEFFESSDLSDGQHTLFANVTSCSSDNLYVMTSLAYIPSSKASVSSASLTTSLSLPTSSTTAGGATSQSHSSTPIGAIVGGVIGGVALLIISAIAIWFFCFRQRHGQPYFYKSAEAGDLLSQGQYQRSYLHICFP